MSFEEAEVLRRRAQEFLYSAELLIKEGLWDLAAFSIEQYAQLLLKYMLLIKTGSYPRTRSLMRLIRDLSKVDKSIGVLISNTEYMLYITRIEDAYIGARYLPREYQEEEVKSILQFVKGVFKPIVERI